MKNHCKSELLLICFRSFVGLFPFNKEKNEEDDFDLVKDNSPFLGNKRPNNKDINDYFDCSVEKSKL